MKSAKCERCGAPATVGAVACGYCGVAFAPGAGDPGGVGTSRGASAPADVLAALRQGNKIDAIRLYRLHHRCSLLEAKNAVEALEARGGR